MNARYVLIAALLVGASGVAAPAFAQTLPAVTAADAAPELEEVMVTAQRRTENLQHAAIPVAVIDPSVLSNAGIVTSTTINAAVPAVVVQKAGGANTIYYVRGVGNFTVNAYADPAVAVNVDGIYLGRPTSTTGTFFDLDRVEVLKGPQGTLYGRNATGGAINVIPAKPQPGETSGYLTAGYGRFKALDLEGAVNAPVGTNGALRVSAKVVSGDGYYQDGTNDEVGQAMRVQFVQEISDRLQVRFAGDYSHQGGSGPGFTFDGGYNFAPGAPATANSIPNYTYSPANLGDYSGLQSPAGRAYSAGLVIPGAFIHPGASLLPYDNNTHWGALAEVTAENDIGTLIFLPAYRHSKLDNVFNGPNFAGGIVDEDDKQLSSEVRLQGKRVGRVDWLLGAYYFDEDSDGRYTFAQYQINSYQSFSIGTKSYAGFGRLTFNLSDRFRLVGGARYTHDKKEMTSAVQTLVEICANAPPPFGPGCFANGSGSIPAVPTFADLPVRPFAPGPQNAVPFGTAGNLIFYSPLALNVQRSFAKMTYRAAAELDVTPSSLMYASYETGFRGGGFSNSLGHETFDPEYLDAMTLGSKNRFLANRAQFNLELFYWKYRNQQVSHFGFDSDNNSSLFTENVGHSDIRGADIDAELLVTASTLLRGDVQYLENTLRDFSYTTPRGGTNLPPVTGCPVSNGTQGALLTYVVDCSGLVGFNAPKWSVNLGLEQTVHWNDYKLVLAGSGRYRSNRLTGFERLPQQFSGSDTTFDLTGTFSPSNDVWFVAAYVRNLTDEVSRVATQYAGTTGGSVSTINAAPRTYGARVGFKF